MIEITGLPSFVVYKGLAVFLQVRRVVLAGQTPDLGALEVSSTVNGEPRQKAPVADLIFDVPELVRTISAGITLLPGDVIATGTPVGVGIGTREWWEVFATVGLGVLVMARHLGNIRRLVNREALSLIGNNWPDLVEGELPGE